MMGYSRDFDRGSRFGFVFGVALFAAGVGAAAAEFTVGSEVPGFSLRTADDKPFTLERIAGELRLTHDGKSEKPKLLAIHLLQPDCLQCRAQLKALEALHRRYAAQGVAVLGISHRGDRADLAALGRELRITFPLLLGTGSKVAREFAAGDTFALIDAAGIVRFAQVGYGNGDEKTWTDSVEAMLAGRSPAQQTIERDRLRVGDPFPAVVLPSLRNGKPMELAGQGDKLIFRDDEGHETRPRCAVGFFSRY